MARQAELFAKEPKRRPVMMHVIDAGNGCGDGMVVQYECTKCCLRSEWKRVRNVTEGKRGIPCPHCNRDN